MSRDASPALRKDYSASRSRSRKKMKDYHSRSRSRKKSRSKSRSQRKTKSPLLSRSRSKRRNAGESSARRQRSHSIRRKRGRSGSHRQRSPSARRQRSSSARRQRSSSARRQRSPSARRQRSSSARRPRSSSARRQRSSSARRARSFSARRQRSSSRRYRSRSRSRSRRRRSRSRSNRNRRGRSRSYARGKCSGVNAMPLGTGKRNDSRSRSRSPTPDRIRLWVPNNDCARIIGKSGNQLKDIEDESGARLKVQREEEMKRLKIRERYVDIRGSTPAREKAKQRILSLADFVKDSEGYILKGDPDEPSTVLQILSDEIGNVLGHKGELVREMENASRARIEIDRRKGIIDISGSTEQRNKAVEKILAEVSFCRDHITKKILKDDAQVREDGSLRMYVLDKEASRVIGRRGDTVREIIHKTNAEVKVQKSESCDLISNERLIQIYGTPEEQQKAMELIIEEVTFAKDAEGNIVKNTGNHNIEPGLVNARAISKGAWICQFCSGDHMTKKCPSREMNAQAMIQMQMLAGMTPMVPGMHTLANFPSVPTATPPAHPPPRPPTPASGMPPHFDSTPPAFGNPPPVFAVPPPVFVGTPPSVFASTPPSVFGTPSPAFASVTPSVFANTQQSAFGASPAGGVTREGDEDEKSDEVACIDESDL